MLTDKFENNCHCPAGTVCLTAKCYKAFSIQVEYSSIKTKYQITYIIVVPAGSQKVTVAFKFISECTVFKNI
jgi:hypothetical protein